MYREHINVSEISVCPTHGPIEGIGHVMVVSLYLKHEKGPGSQLPLWS